MELAWMYAWALFTTSALIPRPFPLPACAVTFGMAAVLTGLSWGRGWRIVGVGMLHLAGLLLGWGVVMHAALAPHYPLWRAVEWIPALGGLSGTYGWLTLTVVSIWPVAFYAGGSRLARRPADYLAVSSRFDLGLGAFFVLFLIKLLMRGKYGVDVRDTLTGYLMLSFFAFGVFAVGMARNRTGVKRTYLQKRRGAGIILSFTAVVLLLGTGAVFLIFPYLAEAARAAYSGIRFAGAKVGPVVTAIVKFIFQPLSLGVKPISETPVDLTVSYVPPETGGRHDPLGVVLLWSLICSIGVVSVLMMIRGVRYLIRWLLSRTEKTKRHKSVFSLSWIRWTAFFHALFLFLFKRRTALGVVELYKQLLLWGKRSGIPRAVDETPLEYGERLARRFPDEGGEFGRIIDAFNLTVYGETQQEQAGLHGARGAWRRLKRLYLLLVRLKSRWFGYSGSV
jgi:hypothetical protein